MRSSSKGCLVLRRAADSLAELDLTANDPTAKAATEILEATANPMIGYSLLRRRRLASFRVEHKAIEPRRVKVVRAEGCSLEAGRALGLEAPPVVAAYVAESRFVIWVPPEMQS